MSVKSMFKLIKQIIKNKKVELNQARGSFTLIDRALSTEEVADLYNKTLQDPYSFFPVENAKVWIIGIK